MPVFLPKHFDKAFHFFSYANGKSGIYIGFLGEAARRSPTNNNETWRQSASVSKPQQTVVPYWQMVAFWLLSKER